MQLTSRSTLLALMGLLVAVGASAETPPASVLPAPASEAPAAEGSTSPGLIDATGEWRGARWGMSVDEVMRHFTGEAKRVEPELKLANGATVSIRIDGQSLLGTPLRAGFVFEQGRLALVSLRTPERHYANAESYLGAVEHIKAKLGAPKDTASDANFIDLRQTTWVLPKGVLDLKYIPGVLVLLYHPIEAKAD